MVSPSPCPGTASRPVSAPPCPTGHAYLEVAVLEFARLRFETILLEIWPCFNRRPACIAYLANCFRSCGVRTVFMWPIHEITLAISGRDRRIHRPLGGVPARNHALVVPNRAE